MIEIETERGSDGMSEANTKGRLIFIERYMVLGDKLISVWV